MSELTQTYHPRCFEGVFNIASSAGGSDMIRINPNVTKLSCSLSVPADMEAVVQFTLSPQNQGEGMIWEPWARGAIAGTTASDTTNGPISALRVVNNTMLEGYPDIVFIVRTISEVDV